MIVAVGRIAAVNIPVTADLEAGYGDAAETVRRAIDVGVVGCNLEGLMVPLADAVKAVVSAVPAGEAAGVPFVLNSRTDAFLRAGDKHRRGYAGRDPARPRLPRRGRVDVFRSACWTSRPRSRSGTRSDRRRST